MRLSSVKAMMSVCLKSCCECARACRLAQFSATRLRCARAASNTDSQLETPPATAQPLSFLSLSLCMCALHIASVGREGETRLRRNRRWALDHNRRGGGDRARLTQHLKDALPGATARPIEIQRERSVWVLFLNPRLAFCVKKTCHYLTFRERTPSLYTDGKKRKEPFLFSQHPE